MLVSLIAITLYVVCTLKVRTRHRDSYHRFTVVLTAMPSPSTTVMGVRASASTLRQGKSIGSSQPERLHRRGNAGEQPCEEIAVFFLGHPDAVPQTKPE